MYICIHAAQNQAQTAPHPGPPCSPSVCMTRMRSHSRKKCRCELKTAEREHVSSDTTLARKQRHLCTRGYCRKRLEALLDGMLSSDWAHHG